MNKTIEGRLFFNKQISGGNNAKTKRFLKGFTARTVNSIGRTIAYTSTKAYGALSLSFGLMTLFLNLGKYYMLDNPTVESSYLVIGAIFAFLGIPLMFFDKPICIAAQDFLVSDYLLYDFFFIKRLHKLQNPPSIPVVLAVFIGFIPAFLGFIIPITYVLVGILVATVFFISFTSPEFPLLLTVLILPYTSFIPYNDYVLAGMSFVVFASYIFRVVLGKRVFYFDIYSILVFIFALFFAVGGFLGYGDESVKNTVIFLLLILSYYPANSLIVNRRLADAAVKGIVFSSLPISVYVIVRFLINLVKNGLDGAFKFYYGSSFGGEGYFLVGAYLLISAIFTMMFFLQKKQRIKKGFYAVFFALNILAIAFSSQIGAVISAVFGIILAMFLLSKRISSKFFFPISLLPYFIPLIPEAYLQSVSEFLRIEPSVSVTVEKLSQNLSVFLANLFIGVGIGQDSFDSFMGTSAPTADNLFLGIGTSVGVFALAVFFILLAVNYLHTVMYKVYVKNSSMNIVSVMSTLALSSLIMYGAFGNLFNRIELFYIFFVIFAISTASLRDAKQEYVDRVGYYDDLRSSETSIIDINLV